MEAQFCLFNYTCTLFLIPKPFKYYLIAARYSFYLGIITNQFIIFRQNFKKIFIKIKGERSIGIPLIHTHTHTHFLGILKITPHLVLRITQLCVAVLILPKRKLRVKVIDVTSEQKPDLSDFKTRLLLLYHTPRSLSGKCMVANSSIARQFSIKKSSIKMFH